MFEGLVEVLVAALTSIATGVLAYWGGSFVARGNTYKNTLTVRLETIYEPLAVYIEKMDVEYLSSYEFEDKLAEIVYENHSIVPTELLRYFRELNNSPNIAGKTKQEIRRHIEANYNWLKKSLGYPFEDNKINNVYIQEYQNKAQSKRNFGWVLLLATVLILNIYQILYAHYASFSDMPFGMIIYTIVAIIALCGLLIWCIVYSIILVIRFIGLIRKYVKKRNK